MAKRTTLQDLAAGNPRANIAEAEAAINLVGEIRKMGIRKREYSLLGPFRRSRVIPKSRRRLKMVAQG